jgi:hypothetical protein
VKYDLTEAEEAKAEHEQKLSKSERSVRMMTLLG